MINQKDKELKPLRNLSQQYRREIIQLQQEIGQILNNFNLENGYCKFIIENTSEQHEVGNEYLQFNYPNIKIILE